jgi:hypothetical protein
MARKQESNWNLEELTDAEIHAAIRRLEAQPRNAHEQDDDAAFVISAGLTILLLGGLVLSLEWLRR